MPKITDKDLGEACANGDGTYNGFKLMQWLFEATTGEPVSKEEVEELWAKAHAEAKARRDVRAPGP
jgi:hypothetical protein